MNIKTELLKGFIMDFIDNRIDDFDIDTNLIADTMAINILSEIQKVIKDENYSDFDAIEKIVEIFEENKIDFGVRHDF